MSVCENVCVTFVVHQNSDGCCSKAEQLLLGIFGKGRQTF